MSAPAEPEQLGASSAEPKAWQSPTSADDSAADYAALVRRGWEMELIISGFLTFALLQVPEAVDRLTAHIFIEGLTLLSQSNDLFALVFIKGLSLILAGHFVLHIGVRAVWVAFIGLQLSFPGGAQVERMRLPERYRRLTPSDLTNVGIMRRLDRLASAIYGFALLVVGCLISVMVLYLALSLLQYLVEQTQAPEWVVDTVQYLYLGLMVVALVDFMSGGRVRRSPRAWVQRAYQPLFLFVRYVGLAFWYQPLYYVFFTRVHSRWFGLFLSIYVLVSLTLAQASTDITIGVLPELKLSKTYEYLPEQLSDAAPARSGLIARARGYADQRIVKGLADYKVPYIQTDLITREQPTLRLTIPYRQQDWFEPAIERVCPELRRFRLSWWSQSGADSRGFANSDSLADVQAVLNCLSERFLRVALDDSLLPPLAYHFTEVAYDVGEQPALRAYIPIDNLAPGQHRLQVRYAKLTVRDDSARTFTITIPFYKE